MIQADVDRSVGSRAGLDADHARERDDRPLAGDEAREEWARVSGLSMSHVTVSVLKDTSASNVYRLVGAGPQGRSIIAKKRRTPDVLVEQSVYRNLRATMPSAFPEHFGISEKGDFTWLFLEDVGAMTFDPLDARHVMALVSWLVGVHEAFVGSAPDCIPNVGVGRYATHLRAARARIEAGMHHPQIDGEGRAVLRGVDDALRLLERNWDALEDVAGAMPPTLVHGDLAPKNILVATVGDSLSIVPIDWETCSWGSPAPDVASLLGTDVAGTDGLTTYCRLTGRDDDSCAQVRRAATVGQILRLVAAMDWVGHRLRTQRVGKPLRDLPFFADRAVHALTTLGLQ